MEPGGIIEAHAHTAHHEGVYVISGRVKLQIGQQAVEAGPGYFGWGPDNVILEVENVGDERAKCLAIFGPPYDPNDEESDRVPDCRPGRHLDRPPKPLTRWYSQGGYGVARPHAGRDPCSR
jgi:hypothetical protein